MSPSPNRACRILLATLLSLAAAVSVAACGSSSSAANAASSSGSSASGSAQFAKYQSCLKSHGVTLPSRGRRSGSGRTGSFTPPGGEAGGPASGGFSRGTAPKGLKGGTPPAGGFGGGRGGFAGGAGGSKQDQAAFKACAKDAPSGRGGFGGGFRGGPAGSGASGGQFSAATLKRFSACVMQHGYTLPKANTSGNGPVYPRSIESNATFQKAAKSCQTLLRPSDASSGSSSSEPS